MNVERRIDPLMPGQIPMIEGRYPLFPDFMELAFTDKQRQALRSRDENRCQFPDPHDCEGRKEVHHILPQRYLRALDIDPDFPENGVTLCKHAHDMIHPDIKQANGSYGVDHDVYKRVFEKREEMVKQRKVYWDTTWDRQLSAIAIRNTQRAVKKGWHFPLNGKVQ